MKTNTSPDLPIYGAGGLLLWFLLHRFSRRPLTTFFLSMILCSALEYGVSVFLKWQWWMRWWDYSGYWGNLNGRFCLSGALCFGLGGMLLNCFLLPWYMRSTIGFRRSCGAFSAGSCWRYSSPTLLNARSDRIQDRM